MRVIEVRVGRNAFADALGAMRSWLDRNRADPTRFETMTERPGIIVIRVEFKSDAMAEAFEQQFGSNESRAA